MLNKKILEISKLVLLYSLFTTGAYASVITSDRFIMKIIDRTISLHDVEFQLRNIKTLGCLYENSMVVKYFKRDFVTELTKFSEGIPRENQAARDYLLKHEDILKNIRHLFKLMRYTEDQKNKVSPQLEALVRDSTKENKCGGAILYKDTLKTNFKILLELELYLRSRYGNQLASSKNNFESVRGSIDLFVDSLDKQFSHEYYW